MSLADEYPLRLLCRLLGVPRSSVYYRPRPAIDEAMLKTALLDLAAEWSRRAGITGASPR